MTKSKIVKNLTKALTICLCCVFCMGVLFSTALIVNAIDEPLEVRDTAQITDLKGYTVTVPSGWRASAGYGVFDFIGIINDVSLVHPQRVYGLSIGYRFQNGELVRSAGRITINETYASVLVDLPNSKALTIKFLGGDTTNPSLIQWFYDNNATFENTSQFKIEIDGVVHTLDFEDGMTLGDWVNSKYNTLGLSIADGYYKYDNEYIYRQYVVADIVESDSCSITYYGFEQKTAFVPATVTITEGATYFITAGLTLYNECYANGYNDGYDSGYGRGEYLGHQEGFKEGYLDGKTDGQSSAIGSNLIGSGFTSITQALNQIILYQSSSGTVVTLWVIISGAVGIALFIWILKLFAGG